MHGRESNSQPVDDHECDALIQATTNYLLLFYFPSACPQWSADNFLNKVYG